MTLEEFKAILGRGGVPAGLSAPLRAMGSDRLGDWDAAHLIVQNESTLDAAWVHAYLHRKEGDLYNAGYWYRRAARPGADESLEREWDRIVSSLLSEE